MAENSGNFSILDLVMFALGETDQELSQNISMAAKFDENLALQLTQIQSMIQTLRNGVFEPVPLELKRAALSLWPARQHTTLTEWIAGLAQTALTTLFDSRETPQLAGFRGQADGRHMTFGDSQAELDVLVEGDDAGRTVRGQIAGFKARAVAAIGGGGEVLTVSPVDEDGTFTLHIDSHAHDLCFKDESRAFIVADALTE